MVVDIDFSLLVTYCTSSLSVYQNTALPTIADACNKQKGRAKLTSSKKQSC